MSISEKNPNMDVEDSHADKLAVNKHMDKAAQFMAETEEYPPLSPEAEKKLMRKVDWIMIPIVSPSESHY
jgi:ACS family allantoate permease-like MFS transporter